MNYWKLSEERPKPYIGICVFVKAHDYLEEDGETMTHQDDAVYCDMYYVPARKNHDDTEVSEHVENDEGYFTIKWQYITHWCYMDDVTKILKESLEKSIKEKIK